MKRRLLALMLVPALLALSGCHGTRGRRAFEVPETFDAFRSYEITFWAKNDTNKTQTAIYQQAIESFQALYPGITVTMRLYTDYGKIYNDVITNIATDTTPNVCITYPDHIATYFTGDNVVAPLDALMDDPAYGLGGSEIAFDAPTRDEIVSEYLAECSFGGHTYALPFMRSTETCYVNQDMVEALGYELPDVLTWDFLWEVADRAAEKDADGVYRLNGQQVMIPVIYKSTDNMMIQLLRQSGAGYSDGDGNVLLFSDATKALLFTIADQVRQGAFSTFKISSYPANFLNAGQCVFAIDSTAGSTWMGSDAPLMDISADKVVPFRTAVRMVPQIDPEHPQMISQGPSVCVFNKADPQEVLASWLFVQYLLSNDVQIPYAETEGYVPVTEKARRSAEYQDYLARGGEDGAEHYAVKLAATKLLLDHTGDTFVTPVFNGSASLRDAAGQLIESVAKSVRRKETVDDAYMEKLFDNVSSLCWLDQTEAAGAAQPDSAELGPLPTASRLLLGGLAAAWALMLLYVIFTNIRRKRRGN